MRTDDSEFYNSKSTITDARIPRKEKSGIETNSEFQPTVRIAPYPK